MLRYLPVALTLLRLGLAPVVVLLAWGGGPRLAVGLCLVAAFLSDIFDGVVARRLGVATPFLRRLDSVVDVVFYVAVVVAIAVARPAVLAEHAWGVGGVIVLECAGVALSFARFGRPPGTHAYSAKAWGVMLFATSVALLCVDDGGEWLLRVTIAFGVLAEVEVLAILLVSRASPVDVRSVVRAWRVRRGSVRNALGDEAPRCHATATVG